MRAERDGRETDRVVALFHPQSSLAHAFTATVNSTPVPQDSLSAMPRIAGSAIESFAAAPQSCVNLSNV